jgi:transcriptional regulator with XRE-family HTH domain
MAPVRSEFAKHFGANLARARRKAGVSQEELSHRASLHRTAVGQLERGERVARAETLFKLACALSVPVGCFFEGMTWETPPLAVGRFEFSDSSSDSGPN